MSTVVGSSPRCSICGVTMTRYPAANLPEPAWFCENCDMATPQNELPLS